MGNSYRKLKSSPDERHKNSTHKNLTVTFWPSQRSFSIRRDNICEHTVKTVTFWPLQRSFSIRRNNICEHIVKMAPCDTVSSYIYITPLIEKDFCEGQNVIFKFPAHFFCAFHLETSSFLCNFFPFWFLFLCELCSFEGFLIICQGKSLSFSIFQYFIGYFSSSN